MNNDDDDTHIKFMYNAQADEKHRRCHSEIFVFRSHFSYYLPTPPLSLSLYFYVSVYVLFTFRTLTIILLYRQYYVCTVYRKRTCNRRDRRETERGRAKKCINIQQVSMLLEMLLIEHFSIDAKRKKSQTIAPTKVEQRQMHIHTHQLSHMILMEFQFGTSHLSCITAMPAKRLHDANTKDPIFFHFFFRVCVSLKKLRV